MAENYQVVYPQKVLEACDEYYRQARVCELERNVFEAASLIDHHLRTDPREFGDPQFAYHHMQATHYSRILSPFVVIYAVHNELNIVFVKSIEKMPNAGF
jgi:hypothetical protein